MARRAYLDHLRLALPWHCALAWRPGFASRLYFLVPVRSECAPVTANTHRLFQSCPGPSRGCRGHAVGMRREM